MEYAREFLFFLLLVTVIISSSYLLSQITYAEESEACVIYITAVPDKPFYIPGEQISLTVEWVEFHDGPNYFRVWDPTGTIVDSWYTDITYFDYWPPYEIATFITDRSIVDWWYVDVETITWTRMVDGIEYTATDTFSPTIHVVQTSTFTAPLNPGIYTYKVVGNWAFWPDIDNYPWGSAYLVTIEVVDIQATVDIDPDTLNLKSKGKWITCYIEIPEDYDVADIDRTTILLNGTIPVDEKWIEIPIESVIGDYDDDGILDLMVKFDREAVKDLFAGLPIPGNYVLEVTGEVAGIPFRGSDTIRVINN